MLLVRAQQQGRHPSVMFPKSAESIYGIDPYLRWYMIELLRQGGMWHNLKSSLYVGQF